jgi:GT2 family glycosyltransferase
MTGGARPTLSVVIPSRFRADLLAACLRSLRGHGPEGMEIIVIDDGSPGGCISSAAAGPMTRVIRHDLARGFCAAANTGVALARADFVQLLNDDTEVAPGWAEAALAPFADPATVAVAPLILRAADGLIDSAGDEYDSGGFARPRGRGETPAGDWLRPCEVTAASGCAAFYRREAFLAAGGFAESFGAYFEDVDLSLRLRRAGGRIAYEPACRVVHRGGQSHGRAVGPLLARQSCNEERLFWRNTNGSLRELGRHAAVLAGKAALRLGEGNLLPWLAGRGRAWMMEASWRR